MGTTALIIIALVSYSLFEIFSAQSGGKIDANLSASIFNGIGFILPIGIYLLYNLIQGRETITTTSKGVIFSIIAGISIAIFSIALVKIFEKGGNLSFVVPLVYGGSIILTGIIGYLWLGEKISTQHLIGLIIATIGIMTIALSK